MEARWQPDILGDGYEQQTIPLRSEVEGVDGAPVATLIRHLPRRRRLFQKRRMFEDVDVLYVHGWSDYFFQRRLAEYWASRGARFYALDLRRYGRSLRKGQVLGHVADLAAYDEEIGAALDIMKAEADDPRRLVLFGHSTGGLVLSLWADRNPGLATAIMLNSPWLELQFGRRTRHAIAPLAELGTKLDPLATGPNIDLGFYARAQQEVYDDEDPYEYDEQWRPNPSATVHVAWLNAILAGHAKVEEGLAIDAPVCALLSARSIAPVRWSEELTRVDSVLNVDRVARAALKLGASVTIERIDGALHDIFLSRREARTEAYSRMDRWAQGVLTPRIRPRG